MLEVFVLFFPLVVFLLLVAFNFNKYFLMVQLYVFCLTYENLVYIAQKVRRNTTVSSNILQHGERMLMFKPYFFLIIFLDFGELWS